MNALYPLKAEQFDDKEQQKSSATLGMWAFIATEVLFFGGLFLVYTVYRTAYPREFLEAALQLNLVIGTLNTAVLLLSSFFMALAVYYSQAGKIKYTFFNLIITWFLGALFLLLKAFEYYDDIEKNLVVTQAVVIKGAAADAARLFYLIYYTITGIHALHLLIGLAVVMVMMVETLRGKFSKNYYTPIEITGLYWHFVDIVWIFIYPSLYLAGRYL